MARAIVNTDDVLDIIDSLAEEIFEEQERLAKQAVDQIESTWANRWSFRTEIKGRIMTVIWGESSLTGHTGFDGKPAPVPYFLDKGTSKRKVVMGQGFRPKTTPGLLKSGSGHPPFTPAGFGYKDGITGRNYGEQIAAYIRDN